MTTLILVGILLPVLLLGALCVWLAVRLQRAERELEFLMYRRDIGAPADVDKMLDLLKRAKTYVEFDAQMMADITRFAPLAPEQQSQHDSTEYGSEKWLKEYEDFMICFEKARQ